MEYDFQSIYDEFQPKILRYITNMVGETEAEDLAQEVFIKASKALPEFRGESKLSTWLYRIATNAALDYLRSTANQNKISSCTTDNVEAQIDDRNIWTGEKVPVLEWQVVRKEMSACLQGYIQQLPERYRTVLALYEFEELDIEEIVEILGITPGNVKIRLHRAREKLKKDLIGSCPPYWVEGNEFLPDLFRKE